MSTKQNLLAGVIVLADGHYYGSAPASADLAATVAAAMAPIDGGHAYTNDGKDIAVYALPDGWTDKNLDGKNRDVIELVTAGRLLGTVGSFSRQDLDRVDPADVLRDRLRVSVDVDEGNRIDLQINPDLISRQLEDGDYLLTLEVRAAGTWFEGFRTLRASEWIDSAGNFEEIDTHFTANELREWHNAIPGPSFAHEAWDAIKTTLRNSGLDLKTPADEDEPEDA